MVSSNDTILRTFFLLLGRAVTVYRASITHIVLFCVGSHR